MDVKKLLISKNDINFENVCREIHDSWGDRNFMLQTLVNLSQDQCMKLKGMYLNIYGEDLFQHFQEMDPSLSTLMVNPFERDADVSKEALYRSDGVDYKPLIEVFTCRKSSHVLLILQAFYVKYRRPLDLEISTIEPPHPCQRMLMALSASHKAHHADISQHIAKCDAKRLYQTGEGKWPGSIDEAVLLEIFSKRSIAQLKLTFISYKHIYGHTYTSCLKSEEMGDFQEMVRVVAKCICNPPKYYAKELYRCLNEKPDNQSIVRILVSRAEVDLDEIQQIFKRKYCMDLRNVIYDSIQEVNDKEFLVALVTKNSGSQGAFKVKNLL